MFLPNSHSFLLVRSVKPVIHPVRSSLTEVSLETRAFGASETSNGIQSSRKVFLPPHQNFWCGGLPNSYSFLLIRKPIVEPSSTPEAGNAIADIPQLTDGEQSKVSDQSKRNFLKVAGITGAGIAAATLFPNKAQALIMGSSPTTGVVGVKNAANTRINPATQETVSTLLKTSDLTFATGDLQVKVTSLPDSSFSDSGNVAKKGLVDVDRHVQVDVLTSALPTTASTETTLQTISFGGKKYTLRLATVGDIDYIGEADIGTATSAQLWRIKRVDSSIGIVIQWAGTGTFNQIWDNRASLSYS